MGVKWATKFFFTNDIGSCVSFVYTKINTDFQARRSNAGL